MEAQKRRPFGVIIIAILTAITALVFLIGGAVGVMVPDLSPQFGGVTGEMAILFLVLCIPFFIVAYGLWKGKRWAWVATLIIAIIGIIMAFVSFAAGNIQGGVIFVIVNGVDLYYLFRSNVKAFFGK